MGLREVKKDRTKTQLLEAALELIARQGFEQTTVSEIAEVVRVSPRTLLRYFPTKEDVIVSWVDEGMGMLKDSLLKRPQSEAPPAALLAAAREMLAAYEARGKFYLVIERVIATSASVAARKQQMMDSLGRDVGAILGKRKGTGTRSGLIYDVYIGTVFAVIRAAIHAWTAANGRKSLVGFYDEAAAAVHFADPAATGKTKGIDASGPVRQTKR